jgi:coproporphyrinogen III oxidase-like Fe-S oxidoreductase
MVLDTAYLLELITELRHAFKRIVRISAYALPKDLLAKADEELIMLNEAGLKLIYVGLESGDDEVLQMINKGETAESSIEALLKAKAAGIKSSVMILSGLGGKKYSLQHAENSARVVNAVQPEFLSTLVLSYPHGMEHFKKRFKGDFEPCDIPDLLAEMKVFISNTALEQSIFRSDHASNYLLLKGTLGREKQRMLDEIEAALENPGMAGLRPEWLRGL